VGIGTRRSGRLVAALAVTTLALAACGSSSDSTKSSASASSGASSVKVGMAYDIGGRGDQSFNDAAAAGLDKAKKELGVQTKEAEATQGETDAAKEERLRLLATSGFNPVVAIGFAYSKAVAAVAKDFPKTSFAIVDDADATGPNVANLVFAEEQGSFLVGAAAALKSTTGSVGFVGGVQVPLIKKFEAGYTAGAKAVNGAIKVQATYLSQPPDFSGFGDPAKGKTAGKGMYDGGADVVFAAAGGSGGGVFEAAKAAGKSAIGVDSDQYKTAAAAVRDVIITSMVKKVDVAVFDFVSSATKGAPLTGKKVYDLKAGGVDYATSGGKVDDVKTKLDDYKSKIISGAITVPTS
jgi:basic membrane protein A